MLPHPANTDLDIDELTEGFGPYTVVRKGTNRKGDRYWVMKFERRGINDNTFRYYNKDGSIYQMNPDATQIHIPKSARKRALTRREALLGTSVLIFLFTGGHFFGIFLFLSTSLLVTLLAIMQNMFSVEYK